MDKGLDPTLISFATAFDAVCAGVATFTFGMLVRYVPARILGATGFVMLATASVLTIYANNLLIMSISMAIFGLGIGGMMFLQNFIWADYFGRQSVGSIRGLVNPITLIVGGLGAPAAGYVRDIWGTYDPAWWAGVTLMVSTAQWVVIAEGLAVSALILPMGRLSDIIGRKTLYLSGLVIFAVAAVLAAGSQSILAPIAFKSVQGFGAAMTQGTGMAIVTSVFPAEERGKGIGSHASVVGAGGVLGPVAGGFLITAFDWRWLFYVNVLMGLSAILAVQMIIRG